MSPDTQAGNTKLGVVVLTFNSAAVIRRTLEAALKLSPSVICVDSGSSDDTLAIIQSLGCSLLQRPFKHYADQRNWAIAQVEQRFAWQLHLDADEVLDEAAITAIRQTLAQPHAADAYLIRRRTYFMGQALRFGGTVTWHLRLFRSGKARCEDRLYDQHFVTQGHSGKIAKGWLHDLNAGSISEWITRHNRWSDLEAAEISGRSCDTDGTRLTGDLLGDTRQRTRYYKGMYYQLPPLWRSTAYFFYRYIARAGFLDGRVGFIYSVLQALWFRTLVDAKLAELEQASTSLHSKAIVKGSS